MRGGIGMLGGTGGFIVTGADGFRNGGFIVESKQPIRMRKLI